MNLNGDPLTAEAERVALEEMLQSDGWAIFKAQMAHAWGPEAFELKVDAALDPDKSSDDELAVTKRIRDTFKGVRSSMKWPEDRVRALKDGAPRAKAAGIVDKFKELRRGV